MTERIEIDGRKCTIAFTDGAMRPVTKDAATLAKIVFDDGEQLILNAPSQAPSK